jgi:hypothetical protein
VAGSRRRLAAWRACAVRVLAPTLLLTLGLVACVPEDIGGSVQIVNETDRPLFFSTARIPSDGGRYEYGMSGCGRPGLKLYDEAGQVVVRVDEKWCAGQVLTVRGPDDYTLESASG